MSAFLVSQIFVSGAVICNLLSFQFKKRVVVLSFLTLSTFLVAWQLYFLDQMAAFWSTLYAVVYFLISTRTTNKKVMWFFIITGLGIIWYSFASYLDYFVATSLVVTLFSIYNENQKSMRQLQMLGSIVRTIYYAIIFSPVGILLEMVLLSSNVTGYWRFYIRKQPDTIET